MNELKFFKCKHCGNTMEAIYFSGAIMVCCGDKMDRLIPNTTDASGEKHVPIVSLDGSTVTVTVGSALHPMVEEHYIPWIVLQTEKGAQRKNLNPGDPPTVKFTLVDDEAVSAFAYCNLHGLWTGP